MLLRSLLIVGILFSVLTLYPIMPGPLDYLRSKQMGPLPAVSRPAGGSLPQPPERVTQVRDRRPVSPTERLGPIPADWTEQMVGAAHSLGIDPKLAASMAVAEQHQDYGQGISEPMPQRRLAEKALRHLRSQASMFGNGEFMQELQSYNGMGKLPAGHYGQDRVIDAAEELPYAQRVMDVRQQILPFSPDMLRKPIDPAVSELAGTDWQDADEISRDLMLQRLKPNLLKVR